MKKETHPLANQIHRYFGVAFNNQVWAYIEKKDRTEAETLEMIDLAHSSLVHWKLYEKSTIVNVQRGEYMIAKAYFCAGQAENALNYAERCLAITKDNQEEMADFDLAYAYEIMAKAHKLNNNTKEAKTFFDLAEKAANELKGEKDKEIFLKDLYS